MIALYVNGDNDDNTFGVEHIPKENKKNIGNKYIKTKIYWIQENDSKICGYFCIRFIDFRLKGKSFLDYTILFFPSKYEKNDNMILKHFQ